MWLYWIVPDLTSASPSRCRINPCQNVPAPKPLNLKFCPQLPWRVRILPSGIPSVLEGLPIASVAVTMGGGKWVQSMSGGFTGCVKCSTGVTRVPNPMPSFADLKPSFLSVPKWTEFRRAERSKFCPFFNWPWETWLPGWEQGQLFMSSGWYIEPILTFPSEAQL